jgi:RimJ/RimL family protein N-acetyltransferase
MPHPYWPLFDLRIRTPRLELRYPDDDDATELLALAARGVHPPDYMPFTFPWTRATSPDLERAGLQFHWRARADTTPEHWALHFATVVDGEIVGTQSLMADDFAVVRVVSTGSWVGQAHQGRGIGKEMRTAVLHLAFAGLHAHAATSAAFVDNPASIAVSQALGYEDDGIDVVNRDGSPASQRRFRLDRAAWEQRRRDDIVMAGLEACLPVLGLTAGQP